MEAIGIERLMFAVDWPLQSNTEGRDFIDSAPRSDAATHIRGQCAPASATPDDLPEMDISAAEIYRLNAMAWVVRIQPGGSISALNCCGRSFYSAYAFNLYCYFTSGSRVTVAGR
jgi:hypothetical protein